MRLAVLAALALTILGFALTDRAEACSCLERTPHERYRDADAAVIGTVISDDGRVGRIRVEHDFKVELGDVVEVPTGGDGAICGLDLRPGERLGLFLTRTEGGWTASTCDLIDPDDLPDAAKRLPTPLGSGTAVLLAYGSFSAGRVAALDAEGRPLAYGRGLGVTYALDVCPGSTHAVELVGHGRQQLVVRRLRDLAVVRKQVAPWRDNVGAIACRDPEGRRLLVSVASRREARVLTFADRRSRTLHRGRFHGVELLGRYAILDDRRGASVLDVRTGRVRRLRGVRPATEQWALSPDGTRAAGIAPGFDRKDGEGGLAVVDLRRPRPAVTRRLRGTFLFEGTIVWLSRDRLLLGGGRTRLRLFDDRLRPLRAFRSRPAPVLLTLAGGRLYGAAGAEHLLVASPPGFAVRDLGPLPASGLTSLEAIPGGAEIRVAG
ncbi:MAG TPA: hypothetical protein VHF89_03255 [Solirubrobacteraceae bacterium]|nr:hypothetical protein [Solirubrobacteraceae bacterium]